MVQVSTRIASSRQSTGGGDLTAEEAMVARAGDQPGPEPVRRFKVIALAAVIAAMVPYLWVLWDLWTGTVDPFRLSQAKTSPGSVIYDQQARALLHGHLSLPTGSIGIEAFIHDGRTYTYFGLFPSLIRMPVLLVTHSLDGRLSAPSMLAAWLVTALFTSLLVWRVRTAVRGQAQLRWPEAASYGLLIFSVLAGSVLMSLASTPWAYTEDEAWAVALSIGSLFTLLGFIERPSWSRLTACGGLILLTSLNRGTTGYACILGTFLVAVWFALGRGGPDRRRWAIPIAGVGLVVLLVGCVIDIAKFSQFFGFPASEQLLFKEYAMNRVNGGKRFSVNFLPSTLEAYLSPVNLRFTSVFPFLTFPPIPSQLTAHTQLFNRGVTASAPASMPLFFAAGIWGAITAFLPGRPTLVRAFRILLVTAAASAGAMLIYGSIFERFLGDFMPLLILAAIVGVVDIWCRLAGRVLATRLLVPAIAAIALFGFVANFGIAASPQDNWSETQAQNFVGTEEAISDVTGHPLSREVLRTDASAPMHARIGQLFILGRCRSLSIAYDNVPTGVAEPWLRVEHAPHTPICHSLISAAKNVSLGVEITAPQGHETVSGTDVLVNATTSGVGKVISAVVYVFARSNPFHLIKLGNATHVRGAEWTYHWDSRNTPNGSYTLVERVTNVDGYSAQSHGVPVAVSNPPS